MLGYEQEGFPATVDMQVPRAGLLLGPIILVFHCKMWMFEGRSCDLR